MTDDETIEDSTSDEDAFARLKKEMGDSEYHGDPAFEKDADGNYVQEDYEQGARDSE